MNSTLVKMSDEERRQYWKDHNANRKEYLQTYRQKNKKKLNENLKKWLKKTGKSYYIPKGLPGHKKYMEYKRKNKDGNLSGTCGIGRKYEKIALKILKGSVDCNTTSFLGKWDIEWNGLKIDVKMRNINARKTGWSYSTAKNPSADFYLCFCVNDELIEKIYFIPKDIFKNGIYISKISPRYKKYILVFS